MNKKSIQLGINHGTANNRLVKDILFSLIVETKKDTCYRCGLKLSRETFSIEHIVPWLDCENPSEKFFNLTNISFSHLSCNTKASRKINRLSPEDKERKLEERKIKKRADTRKKYTPELRRQKYLNTGY